MNCHSSASGGTKELYYGWIIAATCFLVTTIALGIGFSFGVFLNPLKEAFGRSSAAVSVAYSLSLFLYTGLAPLYGWIVDRHGPKVTTLLGGLFLAAGLFSASRASELWQLYGSYGLIGIGMSAAYSPMMTTVSRWFIKQRGLVLGIVSSGIGVGPLIIAPAASYLISDWGWHSAYLALSFVAGLIVPTALLLRRNPPEAPRSLNTEKQNSDDAHSQIRASGVSLQYNDFPLGEALQTRTFWLIAIMFLMVGVGLQIVMAHLVAYSEGKGIPPMTAASVFGTMTGVSIAGRLVSGVVSDRIGRKKTLAICLLTEGIMILWLIGSSDIWMLFIFAIIFGLGYGGHATQFPALTGDMLGLRHMGLILGSVVFFWGIGGALGATFAGRLFDLTGGYTVAFIIGAIAMLISGSICFFIRSPEKTG